MYPIHGRIWKEDPCNNSPMASRTTEEDYCWIKAVVNMHSPPPGRSSVVRESNKGTICFDQSPEITNRSARTGHNRAVSAFRLSNSIFQQ